MTHSVINRITSGADNGAPTATPRIAETADCPPCWERLDRLGWAAGLAFVSHGTRLGVRVNDPDVLGRVAGLLPPGWEAADSTLVDGLYSLKVAAPGASPGVRRYHLLYGGVARLARTLDLDEALAVLESDLHAQVAARARNRLFVHAGVVGWRGRAIVLPGRSFSGKTSLTAALVRAGATYYSDEYAVLDAAGRVHPYLKPLSLRRDDGTPDRRCGAAELGGREGGPPLPVGLIAAARYRPGGRWCPGTLTAGQALMEMLDNTVAVREHPQRSLATLSAAIGTAAAVRGRRGEAGAAALALLEHPVFAGGTP